MRTLFTTITATALVGFSGTTLAEETKPAAEEFQALASSVQTELAEKVAATLADGIAATLDSASSTVIVVGRETLVRVLEW